MSKSYQNVKKDSDALKTALIPLQYQVTQKSGTVPPVQNEFWNHKEEGIYVDIVSGEPLFASLHKFDSGTGWPSCYRPINEEYIQFKEDYDLWTVRTEVRSRYGDSHLGHVFEDGPMPTGLRYCINSAALKFIKREDLEAAGYSEHDKIICADINCKKIASQCPIPLHLCWKITSKKNDYPLLVKHFCVLLEYFC